MNHFVCSIKHNNLPIKIRSESLHEQEVQGSSEHLGRQQQTPTSDKTII